MKGDIFDAISSDDAFDILRLIAREDQKIAKRIEQIAMEYLRDVDIEDIAFEVYFALDCIEVEEVWNRSGNTRDGYVDPTEMAWQIFEEALYSFRDEVVKYQRLSMYAEAKKYCLGILGGIYRFEKESPSEYKDWAVDAPREYFTQVMKEWKSGQNNPEDVAEVEEFIKKNFAGWG
ncbi:hypothetical protein DRO03_05110 [Methanosarcinales archaeon]|nr:MAG: hypothetical protein DRO03_05110 [Methanosarcinales archaeon]